MIINNMKIKVLYKKLDFNYVELLYPIYSNFCKFRYLKLNEYQIIKKIS